MGSLSRSLAVLREVSCAGKPVRFSEMRKTLEDLPDSTLSRLLRSLEEAGYLAREGRAGYVVGPRWAAWTSELGPLPADPLQRYRDCVKTLVRRTNESAGVALLEADRLVVMASETASGAVSIIPSGGILHFEADHAASLAVLALLPSTEQARLVASPYSRISGLRALARGLRSARQGPGLFLDQSCERPGICRMAVAVKTRERLLAVFLCLTEQQARSDPSFYAEALRAAKAELETD